jgi:hypothetical protein
MAEEALEGMNKREDELHPAPATSAGEVCPDCGGRGVIADPSQPGYFGDCERCSAPGPAADQA